MDWFSTVFETDPRTPILPVIVRMIVYHVLPVYKVVVHRSVSSSPSSVSTVRDKTVFSDSLEPVQCNRRDSGREVDSLTVVL